MLRGVTVGLNHHVLTAEGLVECGADLLDRRFLVEPRDHHRAAGEFDSSGNALGEDHDHPGEDHHPGQSHGMPAPAEEIVIGVLENLHGS
jgi:hypothetical protein